MAALEVIALDTSVPQLMAPQAGDTYTFPRAVEMPLGTANGVLYLNGSKVVTSGSALTFDGTNFRNTSGAFEGIDNMTLSALVSSTNATVLTLNSAGTSGTTRFQINGSEQMRLDSTGLGIGTSSPQTRLHVSDSDANAVALFERTTTGSNSAVAASRSVAKTSVNAVDGFGSLHAFSMQDDTSGRQNLGYIGAVRSGADDTGSIVFVPVSGGTATERARIDSSGNLGLGASPAASNFSGSYTSLLVKGNSADKIGTVIAQSFGSINATNIEMFASDSANEAGLLVKGASTAMNFYTGSVPDKRMTLDSSGNLGLGVTPSAWASGIKVFEFGALGGLASATYDVNLLSNVYYDGANRYRTNNFATNFQSTSGQFRWFTAASGTAGDPISFTQAMTLDASGNLLNGTSAGASAVGTLAIFNGTAPTGSVTDGVILYAEDVSSSSELKVRDEAGNVTTLSPHNFSLIPEGPSEEMAWAYYSEKNGKRINVDMLKLARMVEKLTGEQLVYSA
jgi:hypothetical protein